MSVFKKTLKIILLSCMFLCGIPVYAEETDITNEYIQIIDVTNDDLKIEMKENEEISFIFVGLNDDYEYLFASEDENALEILSYDTDNYQMTIKSHTVEEDCVVNLTVQAEDEQIILPVKISKTEMIEDSVLETNEDNEEINNEDVEIVTSQFLARNRDSYTIKIINGNAFINDALVESAEEGDIVYLSADELDGKAFVSWSSEEVEINDNSFIMPASNVTISANYQYLPNQWINDDIGWKYVKSDGDFITGWLKINDFWYYFDSDCYMVTGWEEVNDAEYYFYDDGHMAAEEWVDDYYLKTDGAKAKQEWVDNKTTYVGADGKKVSWITYDALKNVSSSTRLGYYVGNVFTPPEQSIKSYDLAYAKGNRIMVADLRITKDGIPVCVHDNNVSYARNTDGTKPSTSPSISNMTLSELQEYDYGIYKGKLYEGTKLLTLEEMARWIANHDDTKLYIEVKAVTFESIQTIASIFSAFNIVEQTSFIINPQINGHIELLEEMHSIFPKLRLGIWESNGNNREITIDDIRLLDNLHDENEVFVWLWDTTTLNEDTITLLKECNIQYGFGIITTFQQAMDYYASSENNLYATEIETRGMVFRDELDYYTGHDSNRDIGFVTVDGQTYYELADHTRLTGWLLDDTKWYYFDPTGVMVKGWVKYNDYWFYLDANGVKVTDLYQVKNKMYYFDKSGVMLTGWQRINSQWHYFNDQNNSGEMLTGWQKLEGYYYYFTSDGIMLTDWQKINGKWYYLSAGGKMQTGWKMLNDKWYYLASSGEMLTGWQQIDKKWYYFNNSGHMLTGWQNISSKWYYLNQSGVMETGWKYIDKKWYYFNSSGVMQTGKVKISGKNYTFHSSGYLLDVSTLPYAIGKLGWVKLNNNLYYRNKDYIFLTGWNKIDGKWYYMDSKGITQIGWKNISNVWYYFNASGMMLTGLQKIGSKSYYFDNSGAMKTGWKKLDNKWYYFANGGAMVTGWSYINKNWYYFSTSGIMQTGWKKISNKWYYLDNSGTMKTGWLQQESSWYYLSSSGIMQTDWVKIGNDWYYFDSSGKMATGTIVINEVSYQFDNSGKWIQ